jgi:NADP-dependent 3-hydroxy acid dehydrogenase YdfG
MCVVTGTSSPFGRAIAQEFVYKGIRVLGLDSRPALQPIHHDLFNEQVIDVTNYLGFSSVVRAAETEYGPIEGFINIAGISLPDPEEINECAEWKRVLDLYLLGIFNGTQIALKLMKPRGSGTIINVSLTPGQASFSNQTLYHATRCAIRGFTELTWEGLASTGLRFITIAPEGEENTLVPEDIAQAAWFAYSRPNRICLREMVISCAT